MDNYLKAWIEKAEKDLKSAEHELTFGEEGITEAICFHSQQSAEKYLKAFLVFKGKGISKTHNVYLLKKLCSELDKDFEKLKLGNLQYYAVKSDIPMIFILPPLKRRRKLTK